jgi:hypothetical protein
VRGGDKGKQARKKCRRKKRWRRRTGEHEIKTGAGNLKIRGQRIINEIQRR